MHYHGHYSTLGVVALIAMVGVRMLVMQRRRGTGWPRGPGGARGFSSSPPERTEPDDALATGTGTAPGWFTDPFVRHEQRYWSGKAWTEHVLDGGTPSVDPPPPMPG